MLGMPLLLLRRHTSYKVGCSAGGLVLAVVLATQVLVVAMEDALTASHWATKTLSLWQNSTVEEATCDCTQFY